MVSKKLPFFWLSYLLDPKLLPDYYVYLLIMNNFLSGKLNIWQSNLVSVLVALPQHSCNSENTFSAQIPIWDGVQFKLPFQLAILSLYSSRAQYKTGTLGCHELAFCRTDSSVLPVCCKSWQSFINSHIDTGQWPHQKCCPRKIKITALGLWWVSQILSLTPCLIMLGGAGRKAPFPAGNSVQQHLNYNTTALCHLNHGFKRLLINLRSLYTSFPLLLRHLSSS